MCVYVIASQMCELFMTPYTSECVTRPI